MYRLTIILFFVLALLIGCTNKKEIAEPEVQPPTGEINITEFWSEQFTGITDFNYLPNGAGSNGSVVKRIMMGTRSNSTAYAGARIVVSNTNDLNFAKVRFCINGNNGPILLGDGNRNGNIASVSMLSDQFEEIPTEYSLVAWIDNNENDIIDNNEPYSLSDGEFIIVNNITYSSYVGELVDLTNIVFWTSSVPRSRAFFKAFLLNEPIEYGGTNQYSPIQFSAIEQSLQKSLSYNVGVDLNSRGLTTIKNYFFGPTTQLVSDILDSDTFHSIVLSLLDENSDMIHGQFPTTGSFVLPLPEKIIFPFDSPIGSIDFDFSRILHEAQLSGDITIYVTCYNNRIVLTSIEVSGTILDLYDFNYSNVPPLEYGHKAALVQAGYATIGNAGGIFRIEINLNNRLCEIKKKTV